MLGEEEGERELLRPARVAQQAHDTWDVAVAIVRGVAHKRATQKVEKKRLTCTRRLMAIDRTGANSFIRAHSLQLARPPTPVDAAAPNAILPRAQPGTLLHVHGGRPQHVGLLAHTDVLHLLEGNEGVPL